MLELSIFRNSKNMIIQTDGIVKVSLMAERLKNLSHSDSYAHHLFNILGNINHFNGKTFQIMLGYIFFPPFIPLHRGKNKWGP